MHDFCDYIAFCFPKTLPRLQSERHRVRHYSWLYSWGNQTCFVNSKTIQRAITFLHTLQHLDGGWVGSWGICFTYATMFALESLSLVGETYETSQSARRACDFLINKQRVDGGWGESYKVCYSSRTYSDKAQFGGSRAKPVCGSSTIIRRSSRRAGQRWH